jgi:hypothetical protein
MVTRRNAYRGGNAIATEAYAAQGVPLVQESMNNATLVMSSGITFNEIYKRVKRHNVTGSLTLQHIMLYVLLYDPQALYAWRGDVRDIAVLKPATQLKLRRLAMKTEGW